MNYLKTNGKSKPQSMADKPDKYPALSIMPERLKLFSHAEIEEYMRNQIRIERDLTDPNAIMCTREELWLEEAVWRYYGKEENIKASKVFTGPAALLEANAWKKAKGKGVIREKPQKAKACSYCLGRFNCNQYEILKNQGFIDDEM